jgi:hypothetical protein
MATFAITVYLLRLNMVKLYSLNKFKKLYFEYYYWLTYLSQEVDLLQTLLG